MGVWVGVMPALHGSGSGFQMQVNGLDVYVLILMDVEFEMPAVALYVCV